jgi:acetyl-CoA carboxylase / biotin carboxylase 1
MVAKKAIKKMVPWAESRAFFYQRLARRLKEQYYHRILKADGYSISLTNTALKLYSWFRESGRDTFNEDQDFVQWCTEDEKGIMKRIVTIKKEHIISQMADLEKKLTGM